MRWVPVCLFVFVKEMLKICSVLLLCIGSSATFFGQSSFLSVNKRNAILFWNPFEIILKIYCMNRSTGWIWWLLDAEQSKRTVFATQRLPRFKWIGKQEPFEISWSLVSETKPLWIHRPITIGMLPETRKFINSIERFTISNWRFTERMWQSSVQS